MNGINEKDETVRAEKLKRAEIERNALRVLTSLAQLINAQLI